jgi:hypothetical protein
LSGVEPVVQLRVVPERVQLPPGGFVVTVEMFVTRGLLVSVNVAIPGPAPLLVTVIV